MSCCRFLFFTSAFTLAYDSTGKTPTWRKCQCFAPQASPHPLDMRLGWGEAAVLQLCVTELMESHSGLTLICHLDVCISKNCCNLWPGVAFAAWSGLWVGRCSTAFSPGPCRTASSASSAGPGQSWPLRSSLCVCVNLLDCLLWAFVGSCKGAV